MAKKFFYVCAGIFLLALSHHLGASRANAQRTTSCGHTAAQRSSLQRRGDDNMRRTPQALGRVAYLFNYPGSFAGSRWGGVDLSGHGRRYSDQNDVVRVYHTLRAVG